MRSFDSYSWVPCYFCKTRLESTEFYIVQSARARDRDGIVRVENKKWEIAVCDECWKSEIPEFFKPS